MRASQPHRRATAPEQIEAALDARGEPDVYVGAVHAAEAALADRAADVTVDPNAAPSRAEGRSTA